MYPARCIAVLTGIERRGAPGAGAPPNFIVPLYRYMIFSILMCPYDSNPKSDVALQLWTTSYTTAIPSLKINVLFIYHSVLVYS